MGYSTNKIRLPKNIFAYAKCKKQVNSWISHQVIVFLFPSEDLIATYSVPEEHFTPTKNNEES